MTSDLTTDHAVNDRINKARAAWYKIRKSFITNTKLPTKIRRTLLHSAIQSILLYGLHTIQISNKIQNGYRVSIQNA